MVVSCGKHLNEEVAVECTTTEETVKKSCSLDFFDFGDGTSNSNENGLIVEREILHFLNDSRQELNILERYGHIKKLLIKYNTPLPSSASVKRPFSYATMTNLLKRSKFLGFVCS